MSNRITRFLQEVFSPRVSVYGAEKIAITGAETKPPEQIEETYGSLPDIPPVGHTTIGTCEKCGGFFNLESLKPVQHIDFPLGNTGNPMLPHFRTVLFCKSCRPAATVILALCDFEGNEMDTQHFNLEGGYFLSLNPVSGEDQYFVSPDQYNHMFCTNCAELIEETTCQKCRPKGGKKNGN